MTTAYAYDPFNLNHTFPGHPETHMRAQRIWALLEADSILTTLTRVPCTVAPLDPIVAVHSLAYVEQLEAICRDGGGRLDQDTYSTRDSYEAALRAVGGLLHVTDMVMAGTAANGFALGRPPGHHARPHWGKGFCLFGNVAIAARYAQQKHGAERVLIVDFDVHHGNGTAEMFYDDGSVLFFSIHQYPHYPGSGDIDEIGRDSGQGRTVNVPFPAGVGDAGYLAAFHKLLIPLANTFKPDIIFVSAGFDAHWMDPLSGHRLGIAGFVALVEELLALADALCQARLICSLEGGYHLDVLPHCLLSTLRTLSGHAAGISDPFGSVEGRPQLAEQVLAAAKRRHSIG